jgi:hypothetical protein
MDVLTIFIFTDALEAQNVFLTYKMLEVTKHFRNNSGRCLSSDDNNGLACQ